MTIYDLSVYKYPYLVPPGYDYYLYPPSYGTDSFRYPSNDDGWITRYSDDLVPLGDKLIYMYPRERKASTE